VVSVVHTLIWRYALLQLEKVVQVESRVIKSVRYLALGILIYPFLYMILNFIIPILMATLGDGSSSLIEILEYFTWFIMPIFSVFYLLAFHHFSPILGKWHQRVGYILVLIAVLTEIAMPWMDSGLVFKTASFLCQLFEIGILVSCMFVFSRKLGLDSEFGRNA
jgi:MFS family permease